MGGDQRNMAVHSKSDRGRNVYVDGPGISNTYVSVRGNSRAGPPPQYRGRGSHSSDGRNWRDARGQSRIPDGPWRGSRGSVRGANNYYSSRGGNSGRRPPPPCYDDIFTSDSDTKVDRTRMRQEIYLNLRGRGHGIKRGPSKYRLDRRAIAQQSSTSGWQKVAIQDCGHHEPDKVMEEVNSMVGEKFEYHMLATEGNNLTFFLEDNPSISKSLLELSKRLAMPGSNQRHVITVNATSCPPFQPPSPQNLEKIKLLMSERYSVYLKRLDLSMFHKDERLRNCRLLFPLYVQSNLAAVGRLITENIPEVEEIDLSQNKLLRLDAITEHLKSCSNLKRLNLTNNRLGSPSMLHKLRGLGITDLNLEGNVFCNRYKSLESYISDIRNYFPRLLVLDAKELPKPISFEVDDGDSVTPPFQPSYFCNDQAKEIVLLFLKQYYEVFDSSDRSPLQAAYCEDAIFSFSSLLPETGPRAVAVDNDMLPNRNLKVRHQTDDRVDLLFRGREQVMKQIIDKLPPSTHDLDSFVVDVPIAKPQLLKVVINGVYRRENIKNKSASTRAFQRSLIIVPVGGGYCIANEQLFVTLATHDQLKEAFKSESSSSRATMPAATAGPSVPAPAAASVAVGLEPLQMQMIEQFALQSNMLPHYAKLCLEQNSWDFDKAAGLFMKLKNEGKIPSEYFKQ